MSDYDPKLAAFLNSPTGRAAQDHAKKVMDEYVAPRTAITDVELYTAVEQITAERRELRVLRSRVAELEVGLEHALSSTSPDEWCRRLTALREWLRHQEPV